MDGRGRIKARPRVEPVERRELLSGIMIALQSNAPLLGSAQVASIAAARAHVGASASASAAVVPAQNGVYIGANGPNAGAALPASPLLGQGTPTQAELARERFNAHFSGPMTVTPPRFSDQSKILVMRGLGTAPGFFLHGDYTLALVFPSGFDPNHPNGTDPANPTPAVTGLAFLDDKNNNSGAVEGLDLVADPTSFDAKGRPTRLTFTSDPNIYGGIFFVSASSGTATIKYGKNTATTTFAGRIYTSGLTSPFENVDLYAKHSG